MDNFKVGDSVLRIGESRDGIERGKVYVVSKAMDDISSIEVAGNDYCFSSENFKLVCGAAIKPLKHAELIKAWADGAIIQFFDSGSQKWQDCIKNRPSWDDNTKYRIKPDETRGFINLVGKTIAAVDAVAINSVFLTFSDGNKIEINADEQHYGIGVICAIGVQ